MAYKNKEDVSRNGKAHYQKNKEKYKAKARAYSKIMRRRNREHVLNYLLCHPCVDCGEPDPVVLEFDHVRGQKDKPVSKVVAQWSIQRIQKEIDKCEVRCANCHRRATHFRRQEQVRLETDSSSLVEQQTV